MYKRQGAVFSPKGGFSTYLDDLVGNLRKSGLGVRNGLHWYGALLWADDCILLSTSVQDLQAMVDMCASHAKESDLVFSTDPDPKKSKTMCIAFNSLVNKEDLGSIILNGDKLPWKESVKHVGTKLNSNGTMEDDIREKRAIYIQTCMNLNQEFESLPYNSQLKLLNLFNSHYTGSNCWLYNSEKFQQMMNSFNVNIRVIFSLPNNTPCWMVEELAGCRHPRQQIYLRFVKFIDCLAKNKKPGIRSLYNTVVGDVRSLTGANIRKIKQDTEVSVIPGLSLIHI